MTYNILTETEFFKAVAAGDEERVKQYYGDFIASVIRLCRTSDAASVYIALTFAEIELGAYKGLKSVAGTCQGKAMAFMKEMHDMLEPMAAKEIETTGKNEVAPMLEWTGKTVDLVELVYALKESGCVNNGEMPIGKMSETVFRMFGMKTLKDYSRYYVSIKDRETDYSYTYFIDRLRQKLNERIKADIKRSLSR